MPGLQKQKALGVGGVPRTGGGALLDQKRGYSGPVSICRRRMIQRVPSGEKSPNGHGQIKENDGTKGGKRWEPLSGQGENSVIELL